MDACSCYYHERMSTAFRARLLVATIYMSLSSASGQGLLGRRRCPVCFQRDVQTSFESRRLRYYCSLEFNSSGSFSHIRWAVRWRFRKARNPGWQLPAQVALNLPSLPSEVRRDCLEALDSRIPSLLGWPSVKPNHFNSRSPRKKRTSDAPGPRNLSNG